MLYFYGLYPIKEKVECPRLQKKRRLYLINYICEKNYTNESIAEKDSTCQKKNYCRVG
jgi:hypothetical protein